MPCSTVAIRVLLGKPVLVDLVYGVAEHVDRSFQTKMVGNVIFIPNPTFLMRLSLNRAVRPSIGYYVVFWGKTL